MKEIDKDIKGNQTKAKQKKSRTSMAENFKG